MTVIHDPDFSTGEDFSNLFGPDAAIPGMPAQLLPDSANMGAVSAEVGTGMPDVMAGLDSDGTFQFFDSQDDRQFIGMDALQGVVDDRHVEILRDEQMYSSQATLPMPEIAETSEPLIASDEEGR